MYKRLSIQGLLEPIETAEPIETPARAQRRGRRGEMSIAGTRSGAVRWSLVLLSALILACLAAVALITADAGGGASAADSKSTPSGHSDSGAADHSADAHDRSSANGADERTGNRESAPSGGRPSGRKSGPQSEPESGRVRGRLHLPLGVLPPAEWELRVEPSAIFAAGDAEQRHLVLRGDQLDFDLADLPFGSYDLTPRAAGMNSDSLPVTLSPKSAQVYVTLLLTPAGILSGSLEYEGTLPADGILVRLRGIVAPGESSPTEFGTLTDRSGRYEFASLPDGEYELSFGEDINPLLEPKKIFFAAPSMHLPPRTLGKVGQLTIEVVDIAGNPVSGVFITGSGSQGGTIDHVTDANGRCRVHGLRFGHYRLWTEHPGFPATLEVLDIESAEQGFVRIELPGE